MDIADFSDPLFENVNFLMSVPLSSEWVWRKNDLISMKNNSYDIDKFISKIYVTLASIIV